MAVPTFANINPNSGRTLGRELVEIIGSGFQLPVIPDTLPAPPQPPTVEVLFNGVVAPNVAVVNDSRLIVLTPPNAETADAAGDVSAIDIVIRNVDENGDLIGAEEVTAASAYTYQLPELHAVQPLQLLVDRFIQVLKDQVHPNVMQSVHTDWDDYVNDGLSVTAVASFPAIVLDGPELSENRFYSRNRYTEEEILPTTIEEFAFRREPRTVDVGFEILLLSDSVQEILNLANIVTEFMHLNKEFKLPNTLTPPYDPNDTCDLELDFVEGGDFAWTTEPTNSNIRQMRASILIRGFDIATGPQVGKGAALGAKNGSEDPILESLSQLPEDGVVLPVSGAPLKSPPDSCGC